VVEREVKVDAWVKQGEELLDLRRESRFRGRGALREYVVQYLLGNWSTGGPDEVAEAIDKFRAEFQDDFRKALPEFDTTQERRARAMEIGAWLYSTGHIKVQYGITYEGTPIERLSPGTRGIVLLLLYLAVDTHDRRPLFIDQPEENLDPRSVFTELVPHFRSAKQRRQVVMVTHNANLVVNTDADQVIVAASEKTDNGGLPTISYESGS
jgi:DNA repair exonuclease SbcCD ATPase subunit